MSMSTIDSVSSFENLQAQPQTYGNSELGQDAFLQLLVTQLQQQDPLDPQDNEAFVAQLAQFSSLEQLTNANSALESLYLAMSSMNNASMTQLLGKEVRAYGDAFHYGGTGEVELHYEVPEDCTATLTITDESGKVVHTAELGSLPYGDGSYTWDGSAISGTAEEGTYTFSISAQDKNGDPVEVATLIEGEIDGMSFETGSPEPSIDGVPLALGDIVHVSTPGADEGGARDMSVNSSSVDTLDYARVLRPGLRQPIGVRPIARGKGANSSGPTAFDHALERVLSPAAQADPDADATHEVLDFDDAPDVRFSRHAAGRLRSRGINLDDDELELLAGAIDRLSARKAKESLLLMGDKAFIVGVERRTVITAMTRKEAVGSIFTNIDSTLVVR